jgi:5-methylcytosine-specific restriction endonuclease McrA
MESSYGTQLALQEFDVSKFRLGKLCLGNHEWGNSGQTLRYLKGDCPKCQVEYNRGAYRSYSQFTEEERQKRIAYKRKVREQNRALGLTSSGKPLKRPAMQFAKLASPEQRRLWKAIRDAGQCPTVATLVMQEQRRYWVENPKAKAEHYRSRRRALWRARYQRNPDLRLYTREKSKRRKAKARGQTPLQIPVAAIKRRFAEFGNCCAYCSATGDMNLEHVIPISQGGPHDIGNIIPACFSCNMNKGTKPMEQWYRQQPFFNEVRLQQIRRVMRPPEGVQLQLSCG